MGAASLPIRSVPPVGKQAAAVAVEVVTLGYERTGRPAEVERADVVGVER